LLEIHLLVATRETTVVNTRRCPTGRARSMRQRCRHWVCSVSVTWKIAPEPTWILGFGASSLSVALTVTMRVGADDWRRNPRTAGTECVTALSASPSCSKSRKQHLALRAWRGMRLT